MKDELQGDKNRGRGAVAPPQREMVRAWTNKALAEMLEGKFRLYQRDEIYRNW